MIEKNVKLTFDAVIYHSGALNYHTEFNEGRSPSKFWNLGVLDDLRPFRDISLEPHAYLLGRAGLSFDPEIEQPLLDFSR